MSSGVKFSASGTEKGSFVRKDLQRYATKLRELDRNGDGELDLEEICLAVDEMIQTRKENRLIKWFMGALAVVTLLTIAATVGLTAAVIILSKDTSVSNNTLVVKETGESLSKLLQSYQLLDFFRFLWPPPLRPLLPLLLSQRLNLSYSSFSPCSYRCYFHPSSS